MHNETTIELIAPHLSWDASISETVLGNLLAHLNLTLSDGEDITLISGMRGMKILARHYNMNFVPGMHRLYKRELLKSPKSALYFRVRHTDPTIRVVAVVLVAQTKRIFTYHSSTSGGEWQPYSMPETLLDKYYKQEAILCK